MAFKSLQKSVSPEITITITEPDKTEMFSKTSN